LRGHRVASVAVALFFVASGPTAHGARCGAPGLPACPLQQWMRTSLAVGYAKRDYAALAEELAKLGELNPAPTDPTWTGWNRHAQAAAAAAKRKQDGQVVKACAACHVEYRRRYLEDFRNRPVP